MIAALEQIRIAYEREQMTLQEISEEFAIDGVPMNEVAVKAALIQCSKVYRKNVGLEEKLDSQEGPKLDFTDDQLEEANRVIYELVSSAESEKLRFEAACYIRDDKKGRKEPKNFLRDNRPNIFLINESLQKSRMLAQQAKEQLLIEG